MSFDWRAHHLNDVERSAALVAIGNAISNKQLREARRDLEPGEYTSIKVDVRVRGGFAVSKPTTSTKDELDVFRLLHHFGGVTVVEDARLVRTILQGDAAAHPHDIKAFRAKLKTMSERLGLLREVPRSGSVRPALDITVL